MTVVNNKYRVGIIEPVGGHGGMNYYDFGLAEGLSEANCSVTLYTCDKTVISENFVFECKLAYKDIYGEAHKALRGIRFIQGLLKSLVDAKRKGKQIVHLHFFHAGLMELFTVWLVKLFGFKLVITVHDVESFAGDDSKQRARQIFGAADRLIAHNQVSANELMEKIGIAEQHIRKIPHGNYLDYTNNRLTLKGARAKLGIAEDSEVLLFFGQIKQVKGLDLLLRALDELRRWRSNVLLVIAGKVWKDDFSKYQALIDELGIANHVRADIRYIPDVDAPIYYAAADVVTLPYRKIYQSGVLLMAMSFERAVVASDLLGMSEVVTDGETGYLFRTGDAHSLAEKLNEALSSPGKRNQVAAAGLDLMRQKYGWDQIGLETRKVYQEVLDSRYGVTT